MAIHSEALQYLLPIYKSLEAQQSPYNPFRTGNLAANMSNLGMIIGTVLGVATQDAIIAGAGLLLTPLTDGASDVAAIGAIALNTGKIKNVFTGIYNAATKLINPSTMSAVQKAASLGMEEVQALKNIGNIKNVISTGGQVLKTALMSSGEAGSEAMNVAIDVRKKEIEKNNLDGTKVLDMTAIDQTAKAAGNSAYILNQALLNITMPIELKHLLKGKLITQIFDHLPVAIKADLVEGIVAVETKSINKAFWVDHALGTVLKKNGIPYFIKPGSITMQMIAEGAEEGFQFAIQNGTTEYYTDKFDDSSKDKLFDILNAGWSGVKSMGTDEGLSNISGGAFIGVLGHGIGAGFANIMNTSHELNYREYKKQTQDYIESFNKTSRLIDYASALIKTDSESPNLDFYAQRSDNDKTVRDFALQAIKQGNLESRLKALDDLKVLGNENPEEFKKLTQIDTKTGKDVDKVIDSIKKRVEVTVKSYEEVNSAFKVNPFSNDNWYKQQLDKIVNINGDKKYEALLWEFAKDQVVQQVVNYKTNTKRVESLTEKINNVINPNYKELLEAFTSSPLQTLGELHGEANQTLHFVSYLDKVQKDLQDTMQEIPKDLQKLVLEMPVLQNRQKFYEKLQNHLQSGSLESFYDVFFKEIAKTDVNTPVSDPISEIISDVTDDKKNQFIIDVTDLMKLKLGNQFLNKDIISLFTTKGQQTLVKNNINNLLFYTFVEKAKNTVNTEIKITSAIPPENPSDLSDPNDPANIVNKTSTEDPDQIIEQTPINSTETPDIITKIDSTTKKENIDEILSNWGTNPTVKYYDKDPLDFKTGTLTFQDGGFMIGDQYIESILEKGNTIELITDKSNNNKESIKDNSVINSVNNSKDIEYLKNKGYIINRKKVEEVFETYISTSRTLLFLNLSANKNINNWLSDLKGVDIKQKLKEIVTVFEFSTFVKKNIERINKGEIFESDNIFEYLINLYIFTLPNQINPTFALDLIKDDKNGIINMIPQDQFEGLIKDIEKELNIIKKEASITIVTEVQEQEVKENITPTVKVKLGDKEVTVKTDNSELQKAAQGINDKDIEELNKIYKLKENSIYKFSNC